MKTEFKYFVISTLICMFSLTVAFTFFDLYAPLEAIFSGIPVNEIDFMGAINLQPKFPLIIGLALALNLRKLKPRKQGETADLYRG